MDGDQIATMLAAAVKTYAVVPEAAADVIALWILGTWLVNSFTISPRLAITSPTKGCGKTTILRLLSKVVRRPKRAGSISPPALFRAVEQFQPTLLMDECEKYVEYGSDLHALMNEGHAQGATVLRVLGEHLELREFRVFGALAYAHNGRLPDDLEQRSIVIEMQRRRSDEPLAELRDDRCESLRNLARMCVRWADDVAVSDLTESDPDMGGLINRVADNWRGLFAIADAIGEDWPTRIREAAEILAPREIESSGTMLLGDIKTVFDNDQTDRLTSAALCARLVEMEHRPWPEWKASKGSSPKPITPNQLARLLKPFGIKPTGTIRVGTKTAKGYHRHQFEEAWQRYLAEQGVDQPSHRHNANEMVTSATSQPSHRGLLVTVEKCEKSLRHNGCDGVTVGNADKAPDGVIDEPWPPVCVHCGNPERPGSPVQTFEIGGQRYLLHARCEQEWLAGPDPDGWSFNLEDRP